MYNCTKFDDYQCSDLNDVFQVLAKFYETEGNEFYFCSAIKVSVTISAVSTIASSRLLSMRHMTVEIGKTALN